MGGYRGKKTLLMGGDKKDLLGEKEYRNKKRERKMKRRYFQSTFEEKGERKGGVPTKLCSLLGERASASKKKKKLGPSK